MAIFNEFDGSYCDTEAGPRIWMIAHAPATGPVERTPQQRARMAAYHEEQMHGWWQRRLRTLGVDRAARLFPAIAEQRGTVIDHG